jgi:ribosomal protein S19
MSRSRWKFRCLPRRAKEVQYKLWDRDMTIQKKFIGRHFSVYNGVQFVKIKVDPLKVGYKFGEFIYTRKYVKKESFIKKSKNKK